MKKTSQRSLLFRQNVGRTEEEGPISSTATGRRFHFGWRLLLGGAKEKGMKRWRGHAADMSQKRGVIGGSKGDGVC